MKKKTNKRMTKRIAVIITAMAVAIGGVTCAYAATYLKGDVDGNGNVNLKDAQMALKAALCIEKLDDAGQKAADIDNDGKVSLKDTQKILRAALNIISLEGESENKTDLPNSTEKPVASAKPAGNKPSDGFTDTPNPAASEKPAETAKAPDSNNPADTAKPADTHPVAPVEPSNTGTPVDIHTHDYQPVYRTVHHDEVGHYEKRKTKDAWNETTTEGVVICRQCGAEFSPKEYGSSDAAIEAWAEHSADSWDNGGDCDSYTVESREVVIHHDAEYETQTVETKVSRTCKICQKHQERAEFENEIK